MAEQPPNENTVGPPAMDGPTNQSAKRLVRYGNGSTLRPAVDAMRRRRARVVERIEKYDEAIAILEEIEDV